MKIFNNENNTKKVYIQVEDIIMLNKLSITIPNSINTNDIINTHNNKTDFIEFTNKNEIDFFKSIDWIIDYKRIRNLSNKNLKKEKQKILDEISNITNKLNSTIPNKSKILITKYELQNYKLKHFKEILFAKEGLQQLPLPLVPDSDGFILSSENCDYIMANSLDQNKLLLFKKDGTELSPNDRIPTDFVQSGLSIATTERKKNDNYFIGDYTLNNYLSKDKKYLIIEFKIQNYEKDNTKKEENGIKKLIKKLIY